MCKVSVSTLHPLTDLKHLHDSSKNTNLRSIEIEILQINNFIVNNENVFG